MPDAMMPATGVVLVRLPNWLGDTVMALPALQGLRAACPGACVVAVGRWAPLLAGQGVADALVPYPLKVRNRRQLAASLRAMRPDGAILLTNSFESALAARLWGARMRLGYDTDLRRVLLTHAVPPPSPRLHQIDEYRGLLEAAGVASPVTVPAWRLRENAASGAAVSALLDECGASREARAVGLHLGASFGSSKQWPAASFAEVASRLRERGLRPILLGSPADVEMATAVSASAGWAIPSLVARDGPELLPRLLARLACLLSSDTGLAHLAAAVGTPTVTLFGPTDSRLTAPRSHAARRVVGRAPCAPCFLPRCPIDHVCMRDITAAAVTEIMEEALAA
ncbi:MAG: lipopolysaccharide heptosyltransferase II [Candidatus Rokubacteria bacterium]|nr:lipopolysaccharide heptosyltransferase II [Candidatus Rokubacteria bacterium]